jgi:hypothetical protein
MTQKSTIRIHNRLVFQMVTRTSVPPSAGGLCAGRHIDTTGDQHLQMPAREQMFSSGNGVPAARDGVHREHADHGAE